MTQQNLDFEELQELKNQFNLLDVKLEKQRIINEEMIQESMKEKLSYIEKWYRDRLIVCLVAAPIASIFFYGKYITEGFGHWGFSLMILVIGLLEFFLDRKSYKALDVKNLSNMNMTQATENIIKHKQLRNMTNKISILPFIILTIWTILIASGYTWNLPIIMFTIFMFGISFSCELYQMKKNQKRLESVLEQIKKLRE
jgi:L-asparagine transporter-like permease